MVCDKILIAFMSMISSYDKRISKIWLSIKIIRQIFENERIKT